MDRGRKSGCWRMDEGWKEVESSCKDLVGFKNGNSKWLIYLDFVCNKFKTIFLDTLIQMNQLDILLYPLDPTIAIL